MHSQALTRDLLTKLKADDGMVREVSVKCFIYLFMFNFKLQAFLISCKKVGYIYSIFAVSEP